MKKDVIQQKYTTEHDGCDPSSPIIWTKEGISKQ